MLIILSGPAEEHTGPGFGSLVLNDPNENAAFLPFGSGTRACVGQKFVIQVVATLFASLIKKYEVCAISLFFPFVFRKRKVPEHTNIKFYRL